MAVMIYRKIKFFRLSLNRDCCNVDTLVEIKYMKDVCRGLFFLNICFCYTCKDSLKSSQHKAAVGT